MYQSTKVNVVDSNATLVRGHDDSIDISSGVKQGACLTKSLG